MESAQRSMEALQFLINANIRADIFPVSVVLFEKHLQISPTRCRDPSQPTGFFFTVSFLWSDLLSFVS